MYYAIITGLIVITLFCQPVSAGGQGSDANTESDRSSVQDGETPEYPEKKTDRSKIEWLLASPGMLLELPVDLTLRGVKATVGWAEKNSLCLRVNDFLTFDDGRMGLRVRYSAREGGGPVFFARDIMGTGSKFTLKTTAGLEWRQNYSISLKRLTLGAEDIFVNFSASYFNYPDEYFFGTGPGTTESDETSYRNESVFALGDLVYTPADNLDIFAGACIERFNITDGTDDDCPATSDVYDETNINGLESGVVLMSWSTGFLYDTTRKRPNGSMVGISFGATVERGDNRYGFWAGEIELRQKIHLFYGRYLMLKVLSRGTEPFSGKEVPFYKLSEISERETVRGYVRGRFRDRYLFCSSLEYHFPIWSHGPSGLETFVFADAGQVAHSLPEDIRSEDVVFGFGGGMVFSVYDVEVIRIVAGVSDEGLRMYLIWD
ncbi:MAG: hypothetical protein KAV42_06470 [Candidatus Krumholzibacteria bacterium]|nr:hypothetical protein [Candidatus Krumholzibacteria bacterium]